MKKYLVTICLFLAVPAGLYAQEKGTCMSGDCINGIGKIKYPEGNIYQGDFKNGKPNGKGVFTWPDGEKYGGNFILKATYHDYMPDYRHNAILLQKTQHRYTWDASRCQFAENKEDSVLHNAKTKGNGIRLRTNDSLDAGIQATLGDRVPVIVQYFSPRRGDASDDKFQWVVVEIPGRRNGYVNSRYLEFDDPVVEAYSHLNKQKFAEYYGRTSIAYGK